MLLAVQLLSWGHVPCHPAAAAMCGCVPCCCLSNALRAAVNLPFSMSFALCSSCFAACFETCTRCGCWQQHGARCGVKRRQPVARGVCRGFFYHAQRLVSGTLGEGVVYNMAGGHNPRPASGGGGARGAGPHTAHLPNKPGLGPRRQVCPCSKRLVPASQRLAFGGAFVSFRVQQRCCNIVVT